MIDWKFGVMIAVLVCFCVFGFGVLIWVMADDAKNQRAQQKLAAACRKATDQAEHFHTTTKPRVCREDSVECRKLERELFLAVTNKCAKAVK